MNKKYTVIMLIAFLAVLTVSAVLIRHWLSNISADDITGAQMEASDMDAGGVALNSAFTLDFDSPVGSAAVRRCLSVEPDIEIGLHQGASRQQVLVVPAQPLDEDTLYTFKLSLDEAAVSWAFQTTADVVVTAYAPQDRGQLPAGGDICFTFDRLLYADLDRIADYFSITPAIQGNFEQRGRTLRFLAEQDFAPGTVYRVSLKAGLPFTGTSALLSEDVSFAFETDRPAADWSLSGANLYYSDTRPLFRLQGQIGSQLPQKGQIQLFSFAKDDYIRLLCDIAQTHPAWSGSFAALTGCDTEKGSLVLSGDIDLSGGEFTLPSPLEVGCYLLRLSWNGASRELPFMVSDLTVAALPHANDLLLWLHEGRSGDRLLQARVRDALSGASAVSDSSGAALLTGVGESAVCVVESGRSSLVLPVWECGADLDEHWLWRYLYLSQASYECGDELYFWGLVQPRDGSALEYDGVTVYLFDADGEPVLRQYSPLDGGFFQDSLTLPRLPDGAYRLAIWQSGRELVSGEFALGQAQLTAQTPPAETIDPAGSAVLLDSLYYRPGEGFAASVLADAEDHLFLISDEAALAWQAAPFGLFAGDFQPVNQLDSYCSALCYTETGYSFWKSSPMYLDYEDRRLDIRISAGEDDICFIQVRDNGGVPVPGARLAVSVGSEAPACSPVDAIFQDHGSAGFGDEPERPRPVGSGAGECLFFSVLSTDEKGEAQLELDQLTAAGNCYLLVQAIQAGDRVLAGREQLMLARPMAAPPFGGEESEDTEAKRVTGFRELTPENSAFSGAGEDSLLIAAPPLQTRALVLLGQALAGESPIAAAAAADVLISYSGSMMEELLRGCGFDLGQRQSDDGSLGQDLKTSALLALVQPPEVSRHALRKFFASALSQCPAGDEYAACLAALAALERPQLNDVRLLDEAELSFSGRCWQALAAALCGDSRAAERITGQPQQAEEWALYGLALVYCGQTEDGLQALEAAAALGERELPHLYAVAAAGLLLADPDSGYAYRRLDYPEQGRHIIYDFSYSVDGADYRNSFTSDSKYQLPLSGFDGRLRVNEDGGAGFCCFSVSPADAG